MAEERKSLGRGLRALIREIPEAPATTPEEGLKEQASKVATPLNEGYHWLSIAKIVLGKHQPREALNNNSINELSKSIKENGVIQPLLVRKTEQDQFELIAGERRLRAAELAGHERVPVIIRSVSEGEALQLALIENIQREDLNPIEEAKAYQRLSVEFELTQEQIGEKAGKDRVTIANAIRLLSLPQEIQQYLTEGKMQPGHARAILMLREETAQLNLARRIIRENMTVRQAERWAAPATPKMAKARRRKNYLAPSDPHLLEMEERLSKRFGTKVKIETARVGGRIIIEFYSLDDFERIAKDFWGSEGKISNADGTED